jgi:steroid delta-isomerase-like uncharacterized protein
VSADRNRQTMLRFYYAVNAHDIHAVGDHLADGAVAHRMPQEFGQTRQGYLEYLRMAFEAFPDLRCQPLEVVAEGDRVAARLRNTGSHEGEFMGIPATGRPLFLEGSDFCEFDDDGRIVAHRSYADNLEFMRQLGVIPGEVFG